MNLRLWTSAVLIVLCMPTELPLAETVQLSEPNVVGIVQTTARFGQFCSKGQLQFLPEGDVATSEAANAWAAARRFVVRYSAEAGMVTIIPPKTGGAPNTGDLVSEITFLVTNINQCPDGVRGIPTSISVERLDIVDEGDGPDFRVAPY